MRFRLKYLKWLALCLMAAASFFGVPWYPKDWITAVNLLTEIELWITAHADHPLLFMLSLSLIFTIALLPELVEIAKRVSAKEDEHAAAINKQTGAILEAIDLKSKPFWQSNDRKALRLIYDDGVTCNRSVEHNGVITTFISICVENTDANGYVADCSVSIEMGTGTFYPIRDSKTLLPKEKWYIPIANYTEAEFCKCILILIPTPRGAFGSADINALQVPLSGVEITVRVASPASDGVSQSFRIFVGDGMKLKMEPNKCPVGNI